MLSDHLPFVKTHQPPHSWNALFPLTGTVWHANTAHWHFYQLGEISELMSPASKSKPLLCLWISTVVKFSVAWDAECILNMVHLRLNCHGYGTCVLDLHTVSPVIMVRLKPIQGLFLFLSLLFSVSHILPVGLLLFSLRDSDKALCMQPESLTYFLMSEQYKMCSGDSVFCSKLFALHKLDLTHTHTHLICVTILVSFL